jgi:hypothetical protein
MGWRSMRMPLPPGGQPLVGTPQAPPPARRRAATVRPPPGSHLAVPCPWDGRRLPDPPDVGHPLVIRPGATGLPAGLRQRTRAPWPIAWGACEAPPAPDPRQAIGWPVEGEGAGLLVLPSWAVKGGGSPTAPFAHATAPWPWSLRPALRAGAPAPGHGYRAAVVAEPPGLRRGTPHATARDGRLGSRAHVTGGREPPRAADGTRPPSAGVQQSARVAATHACSPLQSLCALLARGPLWQSLVHASGHLL